MGRRQDGATGGRPLKDWIGRTFGNLTVVAYDGKRGGKHYWRCRCLCGGSAVVCQSNLKSGHTKSCGCLSNPAGTRHFVEGTCIESIRSRKVSAGNSSGVRGVYRNKRTGRWAAQITFQGKTWYLGCFESLEEAAAAREQAEEKVFGRFLERHGGGRPAGEEREAGGNLLLDAADGGPQGSRLAKAAIAGDILDLGGGMQEAAGLAAMTPAGRQAAAAAGGAYGKEA